MSTGVKHYLVLYIYIFSSLSGLVRIGQDKIFENYKAALIWLKCYVSTFAPG